ncbi:hypothetical protein [Subtercola boreus]|uniref:hypothetical protein n=1 Tax=Subtercola boreus TaxID=120213 RepID=UPI00209BF8EC|nr:hypothetical protein [Subtercola boreus]
MHAVGISPRLPATTVQLVLAVPVWALREALPKTLLGDDGIDVVTDLTSHASVRCPTADEDRWLQVVPERIEQGAQLPLVIRSEDRHWKPSD